jgi:ATP-dependent Lhr-like helicase
VDSEEKSSDAFHLLDVRIQRWIWEEKWTELREIQERAIPLVLAQERDVILAAATASGKTEAAFFPILTVLAREEPLRDLVFYVSPLKALINDQWARLERLCETLEIPVYPWHGDISASTKRQFLKKPTGVVLITPESLEALFVNRGHSLPQTLGALRYIVVDELHAFIGSERGKQLQSLMHRMERLLQRRIPRVGLSATLGDMNLAAGFLRSDGAADVDVVVASDGGGELKLLIKGYRDTPPRMNEKTRAAEEDAGREVELEDLVTGGELAVSEELFRVLRGKNHLIFPNSRAKVERYSDLLRRACEREGLPNEFWPHHGSLSKDLREETEAALKNGDRPASAVCTTTLELGIDIGAVTSVAQIGPPPSVASLRQRLGRSGRRGTAAIVRGYCIEPELDASAPLSDQLREGLVHMVAVVRLLLERWYEPPNVHGLHLSTLVQQLLSVIAQRGGVTAAAAWELLCGPASPFSSLTKAEFIQLLRALGDREVLMQTDDGLLLHGTLGEKLVNHYTFYAAFTTEEEFRLVTRGKTLGTLPISYPLDEGAFLIFAGRRWRVEHIDAPHKVIEVTPAPAGRPPEFGGGSGPVHERIRKEMFAVYQETGHPAYLDHVARELLDEAREAFRRYDLVRVRIVALGEHVHLFPWAGGIAQNTLVQLLKRKGARAANDGVAITVFFTHLNEVHDLLKRIANEDVSGKDLAAAIAVRDQQKYDWLLPSGLACRNYAVESLDVEAARALCDVILGGHVRCCGPHPRCEVV